MRALGPLSEHLATLYLVRAGWQILARNYRVNRKEIDIIAQRANTVAFVEVKARAGAGYGSGLEAITWKKRREIAHVAQAWIDRCGTRELEYRFDAIAITWYGSRPAVEHIENAWFIG